MTLLKIQHNVYIYVPTYVRTYVRTYVHEFLRQDSLDTSRARQADLESIVLQRAVPRSGGCLQATSRAWLAAKIITP